MIRVAPTEQSGDLVMSLLETLGNIMVIQDMYWE